MGRLVMLLIVAAGLPGILLGGGLAFLVFGHPPILADVPIRSMPGGTMLAAASAGAALVAAASGMMMRVRPTADPQ
jgi:hypothetical protein